MLSRIQGINDYKSIKGMILTGKSQSTALLCLPKSHSDWPGNQTWTPLVKDQ